MQKLAFSFSPNTPGRIGTLFQQTPGIPLCVCHERYLGLATFAGRDKQILFGDIKDKVWGLLNTWQKKLFSRGGKEVLLKAVVQFVPTYSMSCFGLPMFLCRQLESLMERIVWGVFRERNQDSLEKLETYVFVTNLMRDSEIR